MSYSLIIIDIQPEFKSAITKVVKTTCQEEIQKAMNKRASVLFVEYYKCGRTLRSLTQMTQNYDKKYFIVKDDDDGSCEINTVIKHNRFPCKQIRVCGVNTDACVEQTVLSLASTNPNSKIEVVATGCFSEDGTVGHKSGLRCMAKRRNIKII